MNITPAAEQLFKRLDRARQKRHDLLLMANEIPCAGIVLNLPSKKELDVRLFKSDFILMKEHQEISIDKIKKEIEAL
jgi:hypothetical protein